VITTPKIKLLVDNKYLGLDNSNLTQAYLLAVDCRMSSFIRFTVYLETGAVWSGLPIEALYCDRFGSVERNGLSTEKLQPYSCLEGPVSIVEYELLKNAAVETKTLGSGYYLFTINYQGSGLADDPEQYKTHNIVVLENGRLAAMPNNYLRFKDNWFSYEASEPVAYKRSPEYFFAGG
jgi:hypothetical protein